VLEPPDEPDPDDEPEDAAAVEGAGVEGAGVDVLEESEDVVDESDDEPLAAVGVDPDRLSVR
jgi:hypothetical protein